MNRRVTRVRMMARTAIPLTVLLLPGAGIAATPEVEGKAMASASTEELDAGTEVSQGEAPGSAPDSGFSHGLRLGLSLPFGKADGGALLRRGPMSEVVAFAAPVGIDIGYRLNPHWWLGVAAGMALGEPGDDCPSQADCNWTGLRLGAQVLYTLAPNNSSHPWLGLSLGWETIESRVTAPITIPGEEEGTTTQVALRASESLSGPELTFQGGASFDIGESLTVGPQAFVGLGMYLRDTFDCASEILGCPESVTVDDRRLHGWAGLGIRATHGP